MYLLLNLHNEKKKFLRFHQTDLKILESQLKISEME